MKTKPSKDNYFSSETRSECLSNSQVHDFIGTLARPSCEAMALAKLSGKWEFKPTTDMLIGSYVDAYFEGTIDGFKENHPEIFKKDGDLLAKFQHANEIIETAKADKYFMNFLSGEKQTILTGEIFGFKFIGKPDFIQDEIIVDLKVMKDFDPIWCGEHGKLNFITAWGITDQLSIYQELEYQRTGKRKDCYIAALTKEKVPDKKIIYIPNEPLAASLSSLEAYLPRINDLKKGLEIPIRCEKCDYCKSTKKLSEPVHYYDL